MTVFLVLLGRILPLYAVVVIGFIVQRLRPMDLRSISSVLIYAIQPVVTIYGLMTVDLSASNLSVPFVALFVASSLCFAFYAIGKRIWKDSTPNLLGYATGNGNTGFFGLPVAMMLFDQPTVALCIITDCGLALFSNGVGYYVMTRSQGSSREALMRVLRLPVLHAFYIGLLLRWSGFEFSESWMSAMHHFQGAYATLGMLIIGFALAQMTRVTFDLKFIGLAFLARFVVWPAVILCLLALDTALFGFFSPAAHQVLVLISLVPVGALTVMFATNLNIYPEKAASVVVLSTLFALLYVPFMVGWLGLH